MDHTAHARAIAGFYADAEAPYTRGIALVGSVATGTDHPHSDIDLIAAALTDTGTRVLHRDGRMVTITRTAPGDLAASLTRPWEAAAAVPAWRTALILHDPDGTLHDLQTRARAWTWDDQAGAAADAWAASQLVGLAEEVHKIHGMLAQGRTRAAAANRLILALALPAPMAAAHRLLYGSENDLWDAVATAAGPDWATAWDHAAGTAPADNQTACRAALTLYALAAHRLIDHLDGSDRTVVDTARNL